MGRNSIITYGTNSQDKRYLVGQYIKIDNKDYMITKIDDNNYYYTFNSFYGNIQNCCAKKENI